MTAEYTKHHAFTRYYAFAFLLFLSSYFAPFRLHGSAWVGNLQNNANMMQDDADSRQCIKGSNTRQKNL